MAVTHISFNQSSQHGALLYQALRGLENGLDLLNEILGTMTRMIDGDGSQASQFDYMVAKFNFVDVNAAKAAWDELNSLASKLNGNGSTTDVNAALLQAFAKFR